MPNNTELFSGAIPSLRERFDAVLVGAAFGDALGWPHELRATAIKDGKPTFSLRLAAWTKRSGGRFSPHEEKIGSGDYSDDTQLSIAVARARTHHLEWWQYFSEVELPFWSIYQRGGGGASVRAAKSWLKGIPPWHANKRDHDSYFEAGGNGVAMRVAPHVLAASGDDDFSTIASCVLADGVTTHGHPVALVGALAYAYALWRALRSSTTLEYGQLITEVSEASAVWGVRSNIEKFWPTWEQHALQVVGYDLRWAEAVDQINQQLASASEGLSTGALDFDEETMERIGCFDKSRLGAGTVAASASIFLASKYASSPIEGVARAAFARGSDTDTIASMTGGLMGAFTGLDWLRPYMSGVQDINYLGWLASMLWEPRELSERGWEKFLQSNSRAFISSLDSGNKDISLPIGTTAKVLGSGGVSSKSAKIVARSWRLRDELGQTFYVKLLSKGRDNEQGVAQGDLIKPSVRDEPTKGRLSARLAGVTLSTFNIDASRHFYREVIGLTLSRDTGKLIQIGDTLVLRQYDVAPQVGGGSVVYIEVDDISRCWERVSQEMHSSPSKVANKLGRMSFVCFDPDGRMVEIFER